MKIAELLRETLASNGVDIVFGVPGGQTLGFYHALSQSNGRIRHLTVLDERTGAYAADAYARATGKLGVCDGTVGPGATNLVSGLAEALNSSSPILAIVSELQSETIHFSEWGTASQGIDQVELLRPVCKAVYAVREGHEFHYMLNRAILAALTGRPGPVAIIIPMDMFETEVVPPRLGSISTSVVRPARSIADPGAVADAVTLLRDAQRPLLLVGGGAVGCDANEEVLRVAELLQAPVATTWTGKGIIAEDHPLALGVLGNAAGYPGLEDAAKAADLIFMVGTKSSQNSTYRWTIPSTGQKVIHLDVDGMETGRVFRTDVSLVGDARLVLTQLADALTGSAKVDRPEWRAKYSDVLKRARVELGRQAALDFVPIAPQRVVDEISKAAAAEDVFVCDASFASAWGAMYYSIKQAGRRTIFPRGMAGLGFGLPAAVGAAAGRPDASVFLLSGDGGFAYSVQELAVAVKFGLKVRAIVINNGSYGWIKHSYSARFGGDLAETHMPRFDYVAVANGMGCPAIRVERPEDLAAALRTAAGASGPYLVEVITSAEESPIASHRGKAADPYKAPADLYAVTENA